MNKYSYHIVDSQGQFVAAPVIKTRKDARDYKRLCEKEPTTFEVPPYKILRYKLVNPTVIR